MALAYWLLEATMRPEEGEMVAFYRWWWGGGRGRELGHGDGLHEVLSGRQGSDWGLWRGRWSRCTL